MNFVRSLNWIITYRCNCRCIHCDIWKRNSGPGITLDHVNKILSDPLIEKSYSHYGSNFDISICGGEPFLENNLQQIVETIEKKFPSSFKSITTNGMATNNILNFVRLNRNLEFKLIISVDGLSQIHDKIRGKKGAFARALKTIIHIRKVKPLQKIELKLTLIPENYNQILSVYYLAEKLKCDFTFKPAENIKSYTNRFNNIKLSFTNEQLCIVRNHAFCVSDALRKKGDSKKAKFFQDIPFYLFAKNKPEKCSVLDDHITIMAKGEVYACLMLAPLGNSNNESLYNVLKIRKDITKCPSCMLMCGSYKDYKKNETDIKVANIETTLRCNLNCSMCTQRELRKYKYKDMDINTFRTLMNKYPDITHVSFVGGEPFLNKDFIEMMNFLDTRKLTYEITTNGTLINNTVIKLLKKCVGLKIINFSLDGLSEYHNKERGKGVFEKCFATLIKTKKIFNIRVCSVLKSDNIDQILKLNKFLASTGIRAHKIIYSASLDQELRDKSTEKIPFLNIQGPQGVNILKDDHYINKLLSTLKKMCLINKINFKIEPEVLNYDINSFIDGSLFTKYKMCCKQLEQYRFNSQGNRIICEFIRNLFAKDILSKIEKELLPICRYCCKLQMNYI